MKKAKKVCLHVVSKKIKGVKVHISPIGMRTYATPVFGVNSIQKREDSNSEVAKIQPVAPYKNPIDPKAEKRLAILETAGLSALIGTAAAGLSTAVSGFSKKGAGIAGLVGLFAAGLTAILMLPSKLYNVGVSSAARNMDMDVKTREREATVNIYGAVNDEISNPNTTLSESISNYVKVQSANSGGGRLLITA